MSRCLEHLSNTGNGSDERSSADLHGQASGSTGVGLDSDGRSGSSDSGAVARGLGYAGGSASDPG